MGEEHTVHAKLTLDDQATHVLEHIKEGFEHVGEEAHEVAGEMAGIFKSAVGTALGFELAGMVETFKSIGEEVWHAAAGMEDQEKGIRGVLMMIDKEGASLEEMTKESHELNEEFAQMGVATGSSKEVLIGAFEEMSERTSMAREEVKNLTGEMAQAGRAVQGGPGALASGFSMMSMGIIRARNPIVQLIKATGTLHGTAKEVAKQLTLMGPEQAMKVGIAAIGKMSAKMKDVPLSFNETIASMKALREQIYEALGTPVLKALTGPLTQLREYFTKHREEINKWAEEVGHDVGEGLTVVADKIKEGFQYLQAHSKEIKEDIVAAMNIVKETVQFLIDHREAIALAWGGKTLLGAGVAAAPGVIGAGKSVLGFGARLAGKNFGALGALGAGEAAVAEGGAAAAGGAAVAEGGAAAAGGAAGLFGTGVGVGTGAAASAVALGAFAAAIGGVGAAVYQGTKLWDEAVTHNSDVLTMRARKLSAEQAAAADNVVQLDFMIDALYKAGQASDEYITHLNAVADAAGRKIWQKEVDHQRELSADFSATGMLQSADEKANTAASLKAMKEQREQKAANNVMNFNGAITIHQDFKNVDPDRIAIIFKKSLAGSAHAKTMAATNVPHTDF